MATRVLVLETLEIVSPATVLETRLLRAGEVVNRIEIPESKTVYHAGKVLTFSKKKDANAFVQAWPGKVQVTS